MFQDARTDKKGPIKNIQFRQSILFFLKSISDEQFNNLTSSQEDSKLIFSTDS